jgi:hypothetical protein
LAPYLGMVILKAFNTNVKVLATGAAILILNFFATDLHGLSQIFTEGYLLFCFIVNLLKPLVLIRVPQGTQRTQRKD